MALLFGCHVLRRSARHTCASVNRIVGLLYEIAYRVRFKPWDTGKPPAELVELVEGPDRLQPGRAADLGCGTGTNVVYLCRHGWEVTGIDLVGHALSVARRRAAAAGVQAHLVRGDVTRLDELGVGERFDLLLDLGCYHSLFPVHLRDAYARSVTAMAAPGATLLLYGFLPGQRKEHGVSIDELRQRFHRWTLIESTPGTNWLPTTAYRLRFIR
jgi:SAM-dependent methyltransferase